MHSMFVHREHTNERYKKKCDRLFSLFKNVTFSSNGHCIWVIIFNVFLLCSVSLSLSFDKWQYILRIRSHPIRWCEDRCIHYILWRVLLLNLLYTAFIFIIIVKMSRIDLKGRFKHFRSVSRCTPHIYIYIYILIEPFVILNRDTFSHIIHVHTLRTECDRFDRNSNQNIFDLHKSCSRQFGGVCVWYALLVALKWHNQSKFLFLKLLLQTTCKILLISYEKGRKKLHIFKKTNIRNDKTNHTKQCVKCWQLHVPLRQPKKTVVFYNRDRDRFKMKHFFFCIYCQVFFS